MFGPVLRLVPGAPQGCFQSLFFLFPAGFFGSRFDLKGLQFGLDSVGSLCMFLLSPVQDRLRLINGLLPAFALFLPRGLFPHQFTRAALFLPFVGEGRLPLCRLVDSGGWAASSP